MTALGTIRPGAVNNVGLPTTGSIIAAPGGSTALSDDSDGTHDGQDTNSSGTYQHGRELGNTPANFGNMNSLSIQLRRAWSSIPSNSTWDSLSARIMASDGTTVLAASNSGGTFQTVDAPVNIFGASNSSVVAFGYVNTGASKATWDGAVVQVQWVRTRNKGGDSLICRVYEAWVTGDYTISSAPQVIAVGRMVETDSLISAVPVKPIVTAVGQVAEIDSVVGAAVVQANPQVIAVGQIREGSAGYVYLDGTTDWVSTVSKSALEIAGDIDLVWLGEPDDYTPAGSQVLIGKANVSGPTQGYRFALLTDGTLQLSWVEPGPTRVDRNSVGLPVSSGPIWLRATLDVDNGAGSHVVRFYYSLDPVSTPVSSVSWTQLGTTQTTGGTTSILTGTFDLNLGRNHGAEHFAGKVFAAEVRDGIGGTVVANPDFRDTDQGDWSSPPQTDDHSNSWIFNGDAVWAFGGGGLIPVEVQFSIAVGRIAETDALIDVAVVQPQVIAVGAISEVETVETADPEKFVSVGLMSEVDALIAVEPAKVVSVGVLAETDSLLDAASLKTVSVGQIEEIEVLIGAAALLPQVVDVTEITEFESLIDVSIDKLVAVGQVTEVDALIDADGFKTVDVGQIVESESLVDVYGLKTVAVGLIDGVDSLLDVEPSKLVSVSSIDEIDVLVLVEGRKTVDVGLVEQFDSLIDVATDVTTAVGLIAEIDALLDVAGSKVADVGLITETDVLIGVSVEKIGPVGRVSETSTLLDVQALRYVSIGLIEETDALLNVDIQIGSDQSIAVDQIEEIDVLIDVDGFKIVAIGTMTELESLIAVSSLKTVEIGQIAEVDTLLVADVLKPLVIAVDRIEELENLLDVASFQSVLVGSIAETEILIAVDLIHEIIVDVGWLAEVNALLPVDIVLVLTGLTPTRVVSSQARRRVVSSEAAGGGVIISREPT